MSAKDAAGNASSSGIRVIRAGLRTSMLMTPAAATMVVGQARTLRLVDDFGLPVTDATWTVDDPASLGQTDDPIPIFRALAPGEVTVTATWQSLSASATVTVASGVSLPPGTPLWSLPSLPGGGGWNRLVYANRVSAEVPDAYVFDGATVRGVNATGEEVWNEAPALSPETSWAEQVVGDSLGGVLLRSIDYGAGETHALARVPGPTNSPPWRWESPYRIESPVAQAPDGVVFVLERSDDGYSFVTGVDGTTGHTRFRHRVPGRTTRTMLNGDCLPGYDFYSEGGPYTTSLAVGADGAAYLAVQSDVSLWNYLPCRSGSGTQEVSVDLVRVDSNGGISSQQLHGVDLALGPGAPDYQLVLDQVLPEEGGGVLATWSINPWADDAQHTAALVRGNIAAPFSRPSGAPVQLLGADGVALTTGSDDTLTAFDVTSGAVRWSLPTWGQAVAALADGGAAVLIDGTLTVVDGAGQVIAAEAMPGAEPRYWGVGTWFAFDGLTLTGLAGPEIDEALVSFVAVGGNPQGQRALRRPVIATFVPVQFLQDPEAVVSPYTAERLADDLSISDVDTKTISPTTYVGGRATVDGFLTALASPVGAVAFIGHAVTMTDPSTNQKHSVGLRFVDRALIKLREPIEGAQWTAGVGEPDPRYEYRLVSQVKVVFVASCYVGQAFRDLWGLDAETTAPVLIVPANPSIPTDLYWGAQAWRIIAGELSRGATIGQALTNVNSRNYPTTWVRIGGRDDVRLASVR